MHENRETPWLTCRRKRQAGRRRRKPHVRHAQQWGVGWCRSTDEAVEQSSGSSTRGSGEGGGKGANQGERPAGTRGSGTARSSRVTGSDGRTESRSAVGRYPSKVRAVCVNRARTDLCGGCEATRIPTATSTFVVCRALQHGRKTTQLPAANRMPIIMRWLKGRTSRVANQILGRSRQTTKDDRLSYSYRKATIGSTCVARRAGK